MRALLVCATFGRISYLPTMLAGFLSQDYDDKELIIINDDMNVELCCSGSNIKVVNCNKRLLLSEKRNLGIASGYHDVIFPYDDDDIFLPSRVSNHINRYVDGVNAFRNLATYVTYGDKFIRGNGPPNDLSFRKSEWFNVGGYVNKSMTGEDTEIYNKIKNKLVVDDPSLIDFIYGWSGINYHLSCGQTQEYIDQKAYQQLESMRLVGKKYWIEPDFVEYQKYLDLVKFHEDRGVDLDITHVNLGKIDISHLYV